jgi:hypothetical protein
MRELVIQPQFQLKVQLLSIIVKVRSKQPLTNEELCCLLEHSGLVEELRQDIGGFSST